MSKAQVTLFIILGIVILIIFGFAFFLAKSTQEKRFEAKIEKPISDFLKSKTINYYTTTCLDKVSKEALTLIGEQSGFIHKEQGNLIDWPIPYIEYNDKNVSYQIYSSLSGKLKERDNSIHNPYYYPCFRIGPYSEITCYKTYNHNQKQYRFGSTGDPKNNINPDLCKKKITMANYACTCSNPPNSLNCKYSIQAQLEDYIKKKVKECTNFSNIKGYNISKGDIIAEVSFSDKNVLFKIDFPITIKVKGSEPIIEVLHFSLPQQIRFKILYNLARELIKKDIGDITFDIMKDGQELANKYGDIKITRDSITYKNTSIIIIEDKIDEKNYVFMFARENREPALDYMEFDSFSTHDLYVIENQTLNFAPTAFDPDEHGLTNPLFYDYLGWSSAAEQLKESHIYKNPDPDECINPLSGLNEKARCATYELKSGDGGEHTLIIKAQDLGGLYDYQKINILVDGIPDINLILNNTLDIDNNLASIEDPFIFDASGTIDLLPEPVILLFDWKHIKPYNSPGGFSYNWGYTNKIYLPSQWPNINYMAGRFDLPGTHKITLKVRNQQVPENIAISESEITVYRCLPHRSPHASYPFNNIDWDNYGPIGEVVDDFQGNHACCKDDNTREPSTKICYELEDYGCFVDFTDSTSQYYNPGGAITWITPIIDHKGHSPGDQEVYKRTLIRKCSGIRGNICSGDVAVYKIEFDHTCPGTRHCEHSLSYSGSCKY